MAMADDYEPAFGDGDGREFAPPEGEQAERPKRPAAPLDVVSAATFENRPKPRRGFLIPGIDLFPLRNVSAIYGDGGTGKSLLALQLAAATVSGTSWLNFAPDPGGCFYFSAEDDEDETHIRLADMVEQGPIDFDSLRDLRIAIMAGEDCILASEDAKGARMLQTPLYARLEATIKQWRPKLVILDNLADIFAGNENSKPLARQFIGMLRRLSVLFDCTVIVLAHPSQSGMSSGTGTAGNVAWNNSVRSRLYLKRQHDDPKEIIDPDFRRLVTMKANYGATGGEIGMKWQNGIFVPVDTQASSVSSLDRMAAASKAQRVFLHLVRAYNDQGRNISPSPSSAYAPLVFSKHPENEGISKRQFEIALDTLMGSGDIIVTEEGAPSKRRKNIILKPDPEA